MGIFLKKGIKVILIIIGVFIFLNVLAFLAFMIKEGGGTTENVKKQHKLIKDYLQEKDPENEYIIVKKIEDLSEGAPDYYEYRSYVPVEKSRARIKGHSSAMRYLIVNKKNPKAFFSVISKMEGAPLISFVPLIFQLDMLADTGYVFYTRFDVDTSVSLQLEEYKKNGLPYWYQDEKQIYPIEVPELQKEIRDISERLYNYAEIKLKLMTNSQLSKQYKEPVNNLLNGGFIFWVNEEPHYVLFSLKDGVEGIYNQLINGEYRKQSEAVIGGKEFFQENVNKSK